METREVRSRLGRQNLTEALQRFNEQERLKRLRLAEEVLGHPAE